MAISRSLSPVLSPQPSLPTTSRVSEKAGAGDGERLPGTSLQELSAAAHCFSPPLNFSPSSGGGLSAAAAPGTEQGARSDPGPRCRLRSPLRGLCRVWTPPNPPRPGLPLGRSFSIREEHYHLFGPAKSPLPAGGLPPRPPPRSGGWAPGSRPETARCRDQDPLALADLLLLSVSQALPAALRCQPLSHRPSSSPEARREWWRAGAGETSEVSHPDARRRQCRPGSLHRNQGGSA